MTYNDILRANADMFEKTREMLELDKENNLYKTGLSTDEVNEKINESLINDKINRLVEEKNAVLNELKKDYERNTMILSSSYNNSDAKDTVLLNQDKNIDNNKKKINRLTTDVLTLRRQTELSFNEYKKRSFYLFILKNILIYLTLGLFIALLVKNKNIGPRTGGLLFTILGLVIGGILAYNFYLNINRDRALFNKIKYYDTNSSTENEIIVPSTES